jgi:hypothetical protein
MDRSSVVPHQFRGANFSITTKCLVTSPNVILAPNRFHYRSNFCTARANFESGRAVRRNLPLNYKSLMLLVEHVAGFLISLLRTLHLKTVYCTEV